jgi:hypothetical protein
VNAGTLPKGIRRGSTLLADPVEATRELAAQIGGNDAETVVFFCSSAYDLERLQRELDNRFGGADVIGCTTAGEIALDGYANHALVGMSFPRSDFTTVVGRCDEIGSASLLEVCTLVQSLIRRMRLRAPGMNEENTFAILLIDGLAGAEEPVLSAIARELGNIPLVGGSAGDDLAFKETSVFHGGAFRANSAVLALVHTALPFEVFKTQHITSLDRKMVITEADPVRRTVTEINAEPASEEYARMLGVDGQELRPMLLATHPLCVRVGGDDYVRSIRSVNEDGSLTFYCAIDEGIVLSAANANGIVSNLTNLFDRIHQSIGQPTAVLGFDCIFRRLELQERRLQSHVSGILAANNVIGFSTYGEQFKSMHLNQTFSGVAFGGAETR